ncbi:MAG: hypothetical protein AAFR70_11555, partial [Pseudomonadota bacterium]
RLQPVDLRFMRHDRRERVNVRPDRTCDAENGQLVCAAPVLSDTYTLWIVPERLADRVGPEALRSALETGLVTLAGADRGRAHDFAYNER